MNTVKPNNLTLDDVIRAVKKGRWFTFATLSASYVLTGLVLLSNTTTPPENRWLFGAGVVLVGLGGFIYAYFMFKKDETIAQSEKCKLLEKRIELLEQQIGQQADKPKPE